MFGLEIELNPENAARTRDELERFFVAYRRSVARQYDQLAIDHNTEFFWRRFVREFLDDAVKADHRATLYVRDLLFEEGLVQLFDYVHSRGGRGRAISFRFGIVGRAWRGQKSVARGDVPTDPETLIDEWGMTLDEATERGLGRRSFAAILVKDKSQVPVGVIYVDAQKPGAFGDDAQEERTFLALAEQEAARVGLAASLTGIFAEARRSNAHIRILGER